MSDQELTIRQMAEEIAERAFTGATQDQIVNAIAQFGQAIAARVEQETREACAQLCSDLERYTPRPLGGDDYAAAIRQGAKS